MSAIFVANVGSRRGADGFELAVESLKAKGVSLDSANAFEDTQDLINAVTKAASSGTELIIVGGGDGTISASLEPIMAAGATLGVMPLGTGNQFARDLDIAADIDSAAHVIAAGIRARVDVTRLNGNPFMNVATLGLSTMIARNLDPNAKKVLGKFAYGFALFRALKKMRPFHVEWELPSGAQAFDAIQIVVGNGRLHAGPFPLAPDASISDGLLDGYAVKAGDSRALWQIAMRLPLGGHVALDSVPAFRASRVTIKTHPKVATTVDGEEVWFDSLEFAVEPGGLNVLIPEQFRVTEDRRLPRLELARP